jgi:hypothetical protein
VGLQPEDMVQILDAIDLTRATTDAAGRRVLSVRCRVPVVLNAPAGSWRFVASASGGEAARGQDAAPEARGTEVLERIKGPASSTSQDWYGTRMVKDCLESMATQFRSGIDYMPRHHIWSAALGWEDVIGRTVEAEVVRAEIANPPEGESATGEQYVLNVTTDLFQGEDLAEKLVDRIRSGRPPGQSIGGWFTSLQITYDEDGCVEYPINVLDIELDHLAAVRSPANPDSDRIWLELTRKIDGRSTPDPVPAAPVAEPQSRSVPATPAATATDVGGFAPVSASAPVGRAEEDMPITEEDLAKFQDVVRGLMAPLQAELSELKVRSATPTPTPAPQVAAPAAPVPATPDPELAALRAQNLALAAQLAAQPAQRAGHQATTPTPQPDPEVPAMWRIGKVDARSIAPGACSVVVSSGGAIPLSPALVYQHDGLDGVRSYAKAQGEIRAVDALLEGCPVKLLDPTSLEVGGALRNKQVTPEILRSLLKTICFAADQDKLLDSVVTLA